VDDAFTVATFVPAQADLPSFSLTKTGFGIHNILIDMSRAEDPRIRNAWVRGSNPLCGTRTHFQEGPQTSAKEDKTL
jgi:hypothetical protein